MSFHRVVASIVVPCFLLLAGTVAQADDDIPGTVIVDDEDALENPIAWASGADPKTLGQLESALTCDLQDGDAECTAVAVDNATSAVVITLLKIHQANLMEHKGSEAFIKQKKLLVEMLVVDDVVDPEVIAEAESIVSGCKGSVKVNDLDDDDIQDKAVWSFSCKEAAMADFVLTLDGDDAATGQTAAQEVMAGASKKGKIRLIGKDNDGPSALSALLSQLED